MGRIILRMLACVWLALVALRPVVHAQQPPHAARGQSRETSGTLRGPSLDLAYIEWSGEGTPIVLLHGLGGNALSWAGVAESLAGRHVIAPDLPGHGESPAVGDWSLEPLAAELATAVRARWPGGVIWGGHSWGGKLAILAASAHGGTDGVVLVDPVPVGGTTIADPGAVVDFLLGGELASWSTIGEAIEAVRRLPAYRAWAPHSERAFRRGVRVSETSEATAILTRQSAIDIIVATHALDITDRARALEAPVLLVVAEESRGFQATNIRALSDATHEFVPGNHWLNMNSVDALSAVIRQWLLRSALLPVQAGMFSVEGVQLPYERRGAGQPVILIPGWFQSFATWDGQVEALAAAHQVIRFNRGPFGLTADPIDIVALMDHLDVHRAIILAHSAGVLAALRLAVNIPERVEALVLYGPPAGTPGFTIPWVGADSWPAVLRQLGVEADPRAYAREIGLHAFYRVVAEHPMFAIPENQPQTRARLQDMWTEYANAGARDWLDPPSPPASTRAVEATDLTRLQVPTLVIIGSEEISYFRIAADVLHYAIPGAEKSVIPGGGHFVHMVEPERFNAALLEFLSRR